MKAALVLVATFITGCLFGAAITLHLHHLPGHARVSSVPRGEIHAAALDDLRRAVDLDEVQLRSVHEILVRRQDEVEILWRRVRPEVQETLGDVHREIAEQLSPEQRQRFHEWLLRFHDVEAAAAVRSH
jgi:hypothetical protein